MTFTSFSYYFFLPVVYLVFYVTKDRYRWLVLLLASYLFYARFKAPQLILALMLVTGVSYVCGVRLGKTSDEGERAGIFWSGVTVCILLLIGAKLAPILVISLSDHALSATSNLFLSIGISYFSFQAISYLSDIYLEVTEPEPHLGYHALALAFFPKLLQGPIERAGDLLPQLKKPFTFDYDAMRSGIVLFTWGLFKKVVIADRLALYADQVFGHVYDYTGLPLIIGTYAYALQIYFDFSGYTDMARGTARLFGVNLTENFKSPYLATSIAEFWRRWHISFSRWILDYLFKPLQMSWRRWGQAGTALALLVTFSISGLWHGVSSGFVIWGLLHGVYLAASTCYRPYQKKLYAWLGIEKCRWLTSWQIFVTFNLVCLAWVFFRTDYLTGWYVLTHCLDFYGNYEQAARFGPASFAAAKVMMGLGAAEFMCLVFLLTIMLLVKRFHTVEISRLSLLRRWSLYTTLGVGIVLFRVYSSTAQFVYFKF